MFKNGKKTIAKNIFLTGFMGAGKSSLGKSLSKEKGYHFIDTDKQIEKKAKMSIPDIFSTKGESYFRKLEHEVLKKICRNKNQIIALGGGTLIKKENQELVKKTGQTIYLKAYATTLELRISNHTGTRPLVMNNTKSGRLKKIRELLKKRKRIYEKSNFVIRTDYKTKKQIISEIKNKCQI